ncbi:MAG: hypothetical protein H6Q67_996, partial [Firmicutes bacterium]|nr:hypothetical protein [Bacillota bacterium]
MMKDKKELPLIRGSSFQTVGKNNQSYFMIKL